MSKHSEACCRLPPVISEGYQVKGEYKTLNGLKTYVTGPAEASRAVLVAYDIFGFRDQTLQGADILAHSDKEHQYQVYMPDFFEGGHVEPSDFPPQTEEQKKKVEVLFSTAAVPEKTQERIPECIKAAEQSNPNIKAWGALGYCWGGAMVSLASRSSSLFKAAAQSSPAMLEPEYAKTISIPMCILASKDEDAELVKKYEENLKGVKHVETFDTQVHGFMSTRADLKDEGQLKGYERGYEIVLNFFHDNL